MPPLEEVPPTIPINETLSPLPGPRRDLPVGGRLAHFQKPWEDITEDSWVLSVIRKGYKIPFIRRPFLSPTPVFLRQTESPALEEEVKELLLKGAVEKINPEDPGFYSRIFLTPKKNGKLRLIIDLSNEHSVFQNGNGKQSQAIDSTQRLSIFTGFNRCLSPCTYSLAVSEIPPLLYQGSDIPIQGSTLRSSDKFVCLHMLDGYHSNSSAEEISHSVSIFGRLVGQKSNLGRYPQRSAVHHQADFISRTNNQRKEVRFNSCPEFCFYRDGISDSQEHTCSSSAMGQSTRHSESCTLVQETRTSISKTIPVSSEEVKCSCSICCFGQATLTSSSNGSFCSVETSYCTIRTLHSDQYANQESFGMVEQQGKVCPGCTSETTPAISHSFHRRQSLRMGCPSGTGGTSVSWCLVSGPISATHQCFRDESHSVSSKTVSSTCQQYHSHDSHGQFISGSLFEEAGGVPILHLFA